MTAPFERRTIDAIWRAEAGKVTARLVRMVRDVDLAEEIAQEAFVSAIERWAEAGVPSNPGAWLMTTAKNRAIDELRRARLQRAKHELFATDEAEVPSFEEDLDDDVGDDLLRLVFVACHPVLTREGQVALTLRLVGGLSTAEIARAFLAPEPTIAQRIVRAKKTLAEKRIPFEVPQKSELGERLASVLEVVYLIFNEGYAATAGGDWMRPALCEDALTLGRLLVGLMDHEPDVHALVALIELQASRTAARINAAGEPILLLEQDRARWDQDHIARGLAALSRAEALGGTTPYVLQAQIASCHARARTADATDWKRIAALYGECAEIAPGPVVELNRAVAVGFAYGPTAGLEVLDAVADDPALTPYHLVWSVRADLLVKLGRTVEARAALEHAASLAQNERERALLVARARGL